MSDIKLKNNQTAVSGTLIKSEIGYNKIEPLNNKIDDTHYNYNGVSTGHKWITILQIMRCKDYWILVEYLEEEEPTN